jgi:rRNA-processing protein FCF1
MKTVTEALSERIEAERELLREFLLEHSGGLRDLNTPSSSIFIVGPSRSWAPLSQEGRRLQSRLLEMNGRLAALIQALLRNTPEDGAKGLKEAQETLEELIDQSHLAWVKTTTEAFAEAEKALDTQLDLIANLYDPVEGPPIYVPDTNALLWNADLEQWRFERVERFTLLITAAVLGELDRLKIEHRNPEIRERSEGLIRRIKSYRGRGDLSSGVPLVSNVSSIKTIALEPKVEETLPWLDPSSEDDRILASFVEVMREHVRTPVILVTRDINLQNKAEYAGLPFVEPPDPPSKKT